MLNHILHSPIVAGALTAFVSAAATDLHAAVGKWTCWNDAWEYKWSVATFRWFQGTVLGAGAGAGLGWLIG